MLIGFPLALIVAWAFELTPEGIKRETDVDPAESVRHSIGPEARLRNHWAAGGSSASVVVVDNYVLEVRTSERVEVTAEQAPAAELVEREKSIAVLLFDNLSEDAATQPFTNGIHDDILTQISKIRALKVIARTSMERLDPNLSIPEIGTKLGVATVLEGGVQRVGEHRIRINVQLIDCKTEAHLWAETYDRKLTAANIFSPSRVRSPGPLRMRCELRCHRKSRTDSHPYPPRTLPRMKRICSAGNARREKPPRPWWKLSIISSRPSSWTRVLRSPMPVSQTAIPINSFIGSLVREEGLAKAQAAADKALALDDQLGEAYNSLAGVKEDKAATSRVQRQCTDVPWS